MLTGSLSERHPRSGRLAPHGRSHSLSVLINMLGSTPFLHGVLAGLVGLGLAYALKRRGSDWGIWWAVAAIPVTAGYGSLRLGSAERVVDGALWAIPVALIAGGAAAFGLFRLRNEWVGGPAFIITIGGIWTTVPDTRYLVALLGVSAAVVWAWWPSFWSRPGKLGTAVVALLIAWGVLAGSVTRDSGIVGGLGALATLGWFAIFIPIRNRWIWLLAYAVVVLIWARWAGLSASGLSALIIGATTWVLVAIGERTTASRPGNKISQSD